MELRPGYKKTEVGVIPEEWDAVPLGDLFTFKNGLNKAKQFFGYGTPIVNYMDVYGRPGLRKDDLVGRVSLNTQELKNFDVHEGDVFFTRTSETVEEIGVASVMLDEPHDTVFSGFILRARPSDNTLVDSFKKYCFAPSAVRAQIIAKSTYTTRALTNGRSLSVVSIAVPPKAEQEAIAIALSDVDALLAKLDQLIAKKRDIKRAAMQQLLTGKKRLPGFSGEWEVKRLGDIASVSKGTQLHSSESGLNGKFAHLNGGVTPSGYTEKSNTPGNTIAISEGGNSCGYVQFMSEPYWCGGHCYSVIPAGIDNSFLYHSLKGQQSAIMALRVGSGLPNVQKTAILAFKLSYPSTEDEQTAIAAVLSDMDAGIAALEARRDKTRGLKQGMMQELLTGRIRLV